MNTLSIILLAVIGAIGLILIAVLTFGISSKKIDVPLIKPKKKISQGILYAETIKNYDYTPLIEITRIITDNNDAAVGAIRRLAKDYPEFVSEHAEWCEAVSRYCSLDKHDLVMHFFTYWLCGYTAGAHDEEEPDARYGCRIDLKEPPKKIVDMLDDVDINLNYGLDLHKLVLTGKENIADIMRRISVELAYKRYTLITLEFDSENSHLFVVPTKDHDRLIQLAGMVDLRIYRQILV